jgi:outer membrane protein assembly factor BamB
MNQQSGGPIGSAEKYLGWFDQKTALYLAIFSALFSSVVLAGLAWNALRYRPLGYFDAETFVAAKKSLLENPGDQALRESIRAEDLLRRQNYYRSRKKLKFGAYLLFGGLFVFALSMRRVAALGDRLPEPLDLGQLKADPHARRRSLIAILTVPLPVAVATLVAFAVFAPREEDLSERTPTAPIVVVDLPEVEEIPDDRKWTQFLGSEGTSRAPAMDLPLSWNAETGEGILWKTPLPLEGNSSPIIWDNRLFLTGADTEKRQVYCFDIADGSLVWTCTVRTQAVFNEPLENPGDSGFAAPTSVTNGRNVYSFFGTNELAAVDFDGNQVWSRWFGEPDSMYGVATSLCYHKGKVILQLDQGEEGKPDSFLYAINPADGKDLWKTPREVPGSWSSPVVVNTGSREEVLTAAKPWAIAYNPDTGKEIWRASVLTGDVAPVPAHGDGFVYTVTEYSQLAAIRTGGSGDITETHIAWTYDEYLPDVATPVTDGNLLLLPTGYGTTSCFEAKTGKILWTEEFDRGFWSSPILVGKNVFMTDQEGNTFIFPLGDKYELVGKGTLGEAVVATPAFTGSRIYIRGREHLYCIGKGS